MARDPDWKLRTATRHDDGRRRCAWCSTDPDYVRYHDTEWGVPLRDDRALFELLCLEGAQAGLSWLTVLRKRESYRRAFDGFDAAKIVRYDARRRATLLADPGIVRNRLKVEAFITNARAWLDIQASDGSFADFVWAFAPTGRRRRPRVLGDIPVSTPESDALGKALAKRGFKFVGTTICYAFMQASGIVDDHQRDCWVVKPPRA